MHYLWLILKVSVIAQSLDFIRYDMIYDIYLLTAIGLSPGGYQASAV